MNQVDLLWLEILKELSKHVSKPSIDMWFKNLKPISNVNNEITLEAENETIKNWIEEFFLSLASEIATSITGVTTKINIVTSESLCSDDNLGLTDTPSKQSSLEYEMFLEKYTFDNFVVGEGNKFAHAASFAVAGSPGKMYNPLFIYGEPGLGKTHLLQAIGHHAREKFPSKKVLYLPSESFMNDFIDALDKKTNKQFRGKFREVDFLLIDDIQFIVDKKKTMEEFFHTFNNLYAAEKQIVLTSDKLPEEIESLEDRIRTRFSMGLITDVCKPDLETRIAILKNKTKVDGNEIPNDVLALIANTVDSNVRELEGALTRVIAYSAIACVDVTVEFAAKALEKIINMSIEKKISIHDIQRVVSSHYQVKIEDLKSKSRTRHVVLPRQIAMYLSRECTDISFPKIGTEFGGRDHTTVMHAHEKIATLIKKDSHFRQQTENLIKILKNM